MSNASFYNCPCGERRTFANPATLGRWRRLHNKFCDAVGNDQQTEKEFVQGLKKSAKKAAKQARQNTTRGGRNWRDGVNRAPNGDLIMTDQVDIVAINTETGRNEIVQQRWTQKKKKILRFVVKLVVYLKVLKVVAQSLIVRD